MIFYFLSFLNLSLPCFLSCSYFWPNLSLVFLIEVVLIKKHVTDSSRYIHVLGWELLRGGSNSRIYGNMKTLH